MQDKIVVKNLYKIFGPDADKAAELAGAGKEKDEVFRETQGVVAVNDISFSVQEQQIFVVMGLSGSGKSTLIRCLNRLIEPTSGQIIIDGADVTAAGPSELREIRRSKMAMVFQHFALLPHRTVLENAAFALKLRGLSKKDRNDKAMRALEAVGLGAWADSLPSQLSGGMQQRVGIARSLAAEPQILLMDEPFSALDPLIRREMQDELIGLQRDFKTTIVFITHDLHEALKLGDQIAVMRDGGFVQVGPPQAIVTDPADDYVRAFVQDVDRARVVTMGSIAEQVEPIVLGRDDLASARRKIAQAPYSALPVLDARGKLKGLLSEGALAEGGRPHLERLVPDEMQTTPEDVSLHDAFSLFAKGEPVAVLDEKGRLAGIVDPQAVFSHLSGGDAPEEEQAEAERPAAPTAPSHDAA
ncbi:glycine betaine/L-proline ABC transporter ATP-binding protein [Geminicoccaceae bacterium 1502E]|uniref:Quaternary amine transport ATP-binding protein n=1 Tax=Marinimicrococcus flavescens TaxID=3031815 RepID=A0AAP3XST2_9PROT|nr:glycine betaine/L-proline ABC transporter ATP-binding protein [Marinimicrococcus flavescens]MDX6749600.1 glycine betaine/L-proline ABC transporter ATP-binding protein [Geminicoccaceae bacterium 1502E]